MLFGNILRRNQNEGWLHIYIISFVFVLWNFQINSGSEKKDVKTLKSTGFSYIEYRF